MWIIVAFCACPWRLAAPGAWVCALATAIDPSTNKAAAKVIVIFCIRSSCPVVMGGKLKRERYGSATTPAFCPIPQPTATLSSPLVMTCTDKARAWFTPSAAFDLKRYAEAGEGAHIGRMSKPRVTFKYMRIAEDDWQIEAHYPGADIRTIKGLKEQS